MTDNPQKNLTLSNHPVDQLGRMLRDLRISVTDRCNFRCTYCMPKEMFGSDYVFLPKDQLLTFEELTRLAGIFTNLGVKKLRLTGGEPLIRRDLEILIGMLAGIPGMEIALTTNGSFPWNRVESLKAAGLDRITVSLDSLDDNVFKRMNDVDFPVQKVLGWIDACREAELTPLKINMVVKRGVNEESILPMARYFRERGDILRFIEFMDVGNTNGWRMDDVVPAREIINRVHAELPIKPAEPQYHGEVAQRWLYKDNSGEIGIIASVTQAFCRTCTRARLSADGKLYTCLFAVKGYDLRSLLRSGASNAEIQQALVDVWTSRTDRYSEIRTQATKTRSKVEMSYIGG